MIFADRFAYLSILESDNFDVPMELAIPATAISFGLPIAAGDYLDSKDADFQTIEDLTVTMIIGSTEALQENYMTMHKPLKRRAREQQRDTARHLGRE